MAATSRIRSVHQPRPWAVSQRLEGRVHRLGGPDSNWRPPCKERWPSAGQRRCSCTVCWHRSDHLFSLATAQQPSQPQPHARQQPGQHSSGSGHARRYASRPPLHRPSRLSMVSTHASEPCRHTHDKPQLPSLFPANLCHHVLSQSAPEAHSLHVMAGHNHESDVCRRL